MSLPARERCRLRQPRGSAARGVDFVITMLPNGSLVRNVLLGEEGVVSTLSKEALVIDMSTIHPLETDQLIKDMAQAGLT